MISYCADTLYVYFTLFAALMVMQLMTSQVMSRVEYLMPTDNIMVLL